MKTTVTIKLVRCDREFISDLIKDKGKLSPIKYLARTVGYKDRAPSLPKNADDSTKVGYYSRMYNWLRKLNTAINEYKIHSDNEDKQTNN